MNDDEILAVFPGEEILEVLHVMRLLRRLEGKSGWGRIGRDPAPPTKDATPPAREAFARSDYSSAEILPHVAAIFGPRTLRAAIEAIESRAARSAYSTRSWPSSRAMKFLRAFI